MLLNRLRYLLVILALCILMAGCDLTNPDDSVLAGPVTTPVTESTSAPTDPASPSESPVLPTEGTEPSTPALPTEPSETTPGTPVPTDPMPSEPMATDPVPEEPPVVEPSVTEPVPTEPAPSEPATPPVTEPTVPDEPPATEPEVTEPPVAEPEPKPPVQTPSLPEEAQPPLEMQGLKTLQAQSGKDALVKAYWRIADGVEAVAGEIDLQDLQLTQQMLQMVFSCYRNDYPQHFWLEGGYLYDHTSGVINAISPKYLLTGDKLASARKQFNSAVDKILAGINSGMTAYEKELALHDALVSKCTYAFGPNPYSAYGALVEGQAVCEGYARAFQYLMHRAGISCIFIRGTGNGASHAWTAVQIGSSWYYTDPTWADPVDGDGTIFYAYFNLTRAQIDEDHQAKQEYISLPAATATRYNYHVVNGSYADHFDEDQLVTLLKRSNTVRLYVACDIYDYAEAVQANMRAILKKAGITNCSGYGFTLCGRELVLTLNRR